MLTTLVTKKTVKFVQPKLHNITFNLVIKEDDVEVLNKDMSCNFASGDSVDAKIGIMAETIQAEVDRYKAEKAILDSTELNTAVTSINNLITK